VSATDISDAPPPTSPTRSASGGGASAEGAGGIRAWVLACRPATLTAAISPVMVGTGCAIAIGGFALWPALAALFGATCIQIGTNLANDVFDFEKGADTTERLGPTRAVQAGLLTAAQVRAGMWVAFGLAAAAGAYLVATAGWPVVAIGVFSIASGIAYTGGPYPLGYHGLGDLFVMVFFGFVAVCGTVFVQAHQVPALALLASVPPGAIATAVLVVNNLRDREQDARAGKRTLAVRLGERATVLEYRLLLAVAEVIPSALFLVRMRAGIAVNGGTPAFLQLPLVGTVLFAVFLVRAVSTRRGRDLNPVLKGTAMLLLVHSALFAVGLAATGSR
jgi:1,4-dihydroxy-2-naphthoate octaprenyltransferase